MKTQPSSIAHTISRRQFIKASGLYLGGAMLFPFTRTILPDSFDGATSSILKGRVTRKSIFIYAEPDPASDRLGKLFRDEILEITEIIQADHPAYANSRWYKLNNGYVHSAYIQRMEDIHLNIPLQEIQPPGRLGKITVPYTQSYIRNRQGIWKKAYRLYYDSLHWVTGIEGEMSGGTMYRLKDEWLKIELYINASHMQLIEFSDLAPISEEVPQEFKRIEISIGEQTLTAFEEENPVFRCPVSTGIRYMETPVGKFQTNRKFPSKHMGNGALTSNLQAYELVGVPWVTFFHDTGIAFHGTFWHDNFGSPMSHGCVNLRPDNANWIFRWTSPVYANWAKEDQPLWNINSRYGTSVLIF